MLEAYYSLMLRQQIRKLHLFKYPKPELLIANNSGLFFSLAAIREHGPSKHPNLSAVIPPFWLDNTLDEYNKIDWGQYAYSLPFFVREWFYHLNPIHPEDKKITWGQFKELRRYVIEELKKANVQIHYGEPKVLKESDGYKVILPEHSFKVNLDTHFYNSYRDLNTEHKLGDEYPKVSHTVFYKQERSKLPKHAIILGGGRSAIWLANHFDDILFACIIPKREGLPLFEGEEKPRNLIVFQKEGLATSGIGEFKLIPSREDKNNQALWVRINSDEEPEPLFDANFYCAMGFRSRADITNVVDKHNLTDYPIGREWKDNWVAPEEVPVGSLIEATLRWAVATHNLDWAYSTFCYHSHQFASVIISKLQEKDIIPPYAFFDFLRYEIMSQREVKNLDQVIDIYKSSFENAYNGDLPKGALEQLEKALREIEDERLENFRAAPSYKV